MGDSQLECGRGSAIARPRAAWLAAALGLALAACGSFDDSPADNAATATEALSDNSAACQAQTPHDRLTMLEQLKGGGQISCTVSGNFQCPCGSFCNGSGVCQTECAPADLNAPASDNLTCTGSKVCSPDGHCLNGATDPGPQPQLALHIATATITANTAGGAVTIPVDVSVDANSLAFVVGNHPATVVFELLATDPDDASPLPSVQCSTDDFQSPACEIDGGWQFDVASHSLHSQSKQILVTVPQAASAKSWILRAGSEWAASPTTASVHAIPITFPSTDPGSYAGTITWTNAGGTAGDQTLALPVQAVVTANNLALVDPSRVLLPDGHAVFSRQANKTTMLGWLSSTIGSTTSLYSVRMDVALPTYDAATGKLSGTFQVIDEQGNGGLSGTLALQRITDAATCTSSTTCGSGNYCDSVVGACVPGSGPASGAGIVAVGAASTPSAALPSAMVSAWTPTVSALVSGNPAMLGGAGRSAMEHAYCFQAANQGVAASLQYTPASLMSPSQDLGCAYPAVAPYAQLTFPYANLHSEVGPSAGGDALALLHNCLTELGAQPTGILASDMALTQCASLGRFFAALAPAEDSDTATRLTTQVLRQWAGLNAYVANTTVQDQAYDNALNAVNADDATRFGTAIDRVQQDLLVFLDQTVRSHYLAGTTWPVVAVNPDYRLRRPVVRWTFNGAASPVPDAEGSTVTLGIAGGTLAQSALATNGQGACQSTQAITLDDGVTHNRFSVAFVLNGLPTNGTITLFEKDGPSGDRFWIEGTAVAGGVTIAAKDSANHSVTFPVLNLTTADTTWFFLVDDNGTYRLDVRRSASASSSSSAPSSIVGGGPRWGVPGTVMLACGAPTSCTAYNTCNSFDLNTAGDGRDTTFSSIAEVGWASVKTCTCGPVCHGGGTCTGSVGTQAQCAASATAKYNQIVNGNPKPPVSVTNLLSVTGTLTVGSPDSWDDGNGGTITETIGECDLDERSIPVPHTRAKPACGCQPNLSYLPSASYDEVSLWNRPLGPEEEDLMVKTYNYQTAQESLPPKPATLGGTEQADGLPPQLLEAGAAYAHLLTAYVSAASGAIYAQCYRGAPSPMLQTVLTRVGPGLRLSRVLADQAAELASAPGATTAPWYARYQADVRQLAGEVHGALAALHQVSSCTNPLGIDEGEIPLYIGDASGLSANDRFFAGTRAIVNLIEQTGSTPGELTLAANALQAAQAAYAAQQQSDFQVALTQTDRTTTLIALHTQYETSLRKYCGVPGAGDLLDAFTSGAVTADNCFLATERAGCANAASLAVRDVPPGCLRGDMGNHILAIQTAGIDVDNAKKAGDRALDQWNGDESYCEARQVFENQGVDLATTHFARLAHLRERQKTADNIFSVIDGALAIGVAAVAVYVSGGAALPIAGAIAGAAKSLSADASGIYSRQLAADAATESDDYQLELTKRGAVQDIIDCYHKADADKFAFDQAVDITGRDMQLAAAAGAAFLDDRDQVRGLIDQFQGQQSRLNTIDRTPPHLHYWLDNAITSYQSHMRNARRLAYLAVRTYEYEAQVSSSQRQAVLSARTPNDLMSAMSALNVASAAFAGQLPNQGSPGQTATVFSVRDDILDLGGLITAQTPPGQPPPVTKEQAFTTLLTSDSSKLYDRSGNLQGHAIRFTLLGDAPWNRQTCAERIWRITPSVSVSGGGPSGPNATQLVLYQDNTFGSQVCTDPTNPDVEQGTVSLVRYQPVSNLLIGDDPVTFSSPDGMSPVTLDYFVNKDKLELQAAQQGDNPFGFVSGFAGRGILGSYILLFPACSGCSSTQGWTDSQLANVTDVLLRFDIVTASNIDAASSVQGDAQ